uniref:Uncharacterized protein n=1 Tax=Glossina austeni TaxID=7395 RepID=A0A1A9VWT1_GLOAU
MHHRKAMSEGTLERELKRISGFFIFLCSLRFFCKSSIEPPPPATIPVCVSAGVIVTLSNTEVLAAEEDEGNKSLLWLPKVGLALPVRLLNGIFLEEYARPVECSGIKSAPPANLPTPAPGSAFSGLIRVLLVFERAEAFFTCFFNFFNSLELSSVSKGGNLLPTPAARDDTALLANISSALKAGCVAFKFDGVNVLLLIVLDTCDVSSESSDTSMGSSAFNLFNDNPPGVDVAAIAIICCCNCFSFKENIGNILAAAPVSNGLLGFRGFNRGAATALYGGGNNPASIFSFLFFLSIAFDRTPGNFGEFLLPGLRPRFFGLLAISTFSAAFSPNTRLSIDKS